jgi:hypothetical protein
MQKMPREFPLHHYAQLQRLKLKLWQKAILFQLKGRAKRRGLEFNLALEDLAIPKVCPVLGIKLRFGRGKMSPNSPSVDRLDNRLGYTKDNVRVISYRANALKNNATLTELRAIVAYMEGRHPLVREESKSP